LGKCKIQVLSCTDFSWLQNENFPVQDENIVNENALSCDEETIKVRIITLILGEQTASNDLLSA
jgi:hypothetical protein